MKSLLAAFAFMMLCYSANGQILISLLLGDKLNSENLEFGLDGGASVPTIRGLDEGQMRARLNLGFYFDIKFKKPQWMFHTGVMMKSSMGTYGLSPYSLGNPYLDSVFANGQVERRINYFNVPLELKYLFKNHFFVQAGVMPSLRYSASDIFTAEVIDKDDLNYKLNVKNQYHPLDFGLIGGIGYRLMKGHGMNLNVRYYYGLIDIVTSPFLGQLVNIHTQI